ncbi:MAG: T9SS type A sorting domain-containing protein [Bacteroidetes bacterium]|nr:T9SS type A sorting domain-containing protein [Bacteroidota bacterium]MCL2301824.1 T9SS type A sorting domain-containing protein [Lentimicrobiaceae bacterium]
MKKLYSLIKTTANGVPRIVCLLFLTFCFVVPVFAQQSITTSGGNATGVGGSASYSVGQLDYQNYSGGNGSIAEGVQQPYEISEVGITDYEGIAIDCQVYPNPTNDVIQLRITNYELRGGADLQLAIFDLNGKQLLQQEIAGEHTEISMSHLPTGTYLLHILADKKPAKAFKIIKN